MGWRAQTRCRRRAPFALALAAAVVIAGCGGDDDPIEPVTTEATTEESGSVSQEDFIAEADPRCAEANAAIANLSTGTETSSLASDQQLEITESLLGGLQAIGEPEDPDGSLTDYYNALEDEIAALEQQADAAASGDTATADSFESTISAVQTEAQSAAESYGFEECGQQGTALEPGDTSTTAVPTTPEVPATPVPVEPAAPVTPVEPVAPAPEPVPEAPPSGGTDTGGGTDGGGGGGGGGGSSGGISPG